jgi:hypothetical protein
VTYAIVGLVAAVVTLYAVTYASVPTSDGYQWIAVIDRGDVREMLPAYHALPMYVVFHLQALLATAGVTLDTLRIVQGVNTGLAAAGAALLCATVVAVGGGVALGVVAGAGLAVSFAYWYFANGELHHFSLILMQMIFLVLLRARADGRGPSRTAIGALAALNAVAVMFHQENFLFGFAAIALLATGRPWRRGLADGVVYTVAGSAATAVLAVLIGVGLRGTEGLDGWLRWFFWVFYTAGDPQPYVLGNAATAFGRMAKGQLTALGFGTQIAVDALHDPGLLRIASVSVAIVLTLTAYAIVLGLAVRLWRRRRSLSPLARAAAVASVVWLGAYKLLLSWWFWPTAPEYHIVTLPPLLLLLALGALPDCAPGRLRAVRRLAAPAALVALVGVVNLQMAIVPWRHYGRMKDALAERARVTFRPDDLFVSSESGIDPVLDGTGEHLKLKALFAASAPDAAASAVREAIATRLAAGRRVFVYNLEPSPFTLLGLTQAAVVRGAPPPAAADFDALASALRARYALVPALAYWEESKAPLYLYGRRQDWIFEVTAKPASR